MAQVFFPEKIYELWAFDFYLHFSYFFMCLGPDFSHFNHKVLLVKYEKKNKFKTQKICNNYNDPLQVLG